MKITRSSTMQSLILAAALSTGPGFVSPVSAQQVHAYLVDSNGKGLTDLGTLGGGTSRASGINDAGQVVGESDTLEGTRHVFVTGPNGAGMTELAAVVNPPTGFTYVSATAINNHGQLAVVGEAVSVVPEPETYAMLLAGLGLLGFMARRRRTA